jgi:23S rRNA G2445 N2-methylase RlmL
MTSRRATDFDLRGAIDDPGFTPRVRDAQGLLDLLAEGGALAAPAERALLRLGGAAHAPAIARAAAGSPGQAAVVRLLGRLGAAEPNPEIAAALVTALATGDERVRRAAAIALGKARPAEAEEALSTAARREASASARRAVIEALGKVGGDTARETIRAEETRGDPEVARERTRAALMIDRTAARAEPASIDAARPAAEPVRVALRCRAGLETILLEELPASLGARVRRNPPGGVRLEGLLRGAPADLFAARTLLSFGFPLDPQPASIDPAEAIIAALTTPSALSILRQWTVGPLRYRLAFQGGGKRRAAVWRVAEGASRLAPDLVNDPTGSPWEAVVYEGAGVVRVELVPSVPDPRFTYRTGDVPAASHPTIAAALVRAAGLRDDDVVWDPFAGSGTELCERALAGPYRSLVGSDLDEGALAVAKANLEAAGARDVTLIQGDATRLTPPGDAPTLIITNPPLGRRVQRTAALAPLLDRFVEHAAGLLAPGGRLSWISPFPERTRAVAEALGLVSLVAQEVDLGGFAAELQVLHRPPEAKARRRRD